MVSVDSTANRRISIINIADEDPSQSPRIFFFDMPTVNSSPSKPALDDVDTSAPTAKSSAASSGIPYQPASSSKSSAMAGRGLDSPPTRARSSTVLAKEAGKPAITEKPTTVVDTATNSSPSRQRPIALLSRFSYSSSPIERPSSVISRDSDPSSPRGTPPAVGRFGRISSSAEQRSHEVTRDSSKSPPTDRSPPARKRVGDSSPTTKYSPALISGLGRLSSPAKNRSYVGRGVSSLSQLAEKPPPVYGAVTTTRPPTPKSLEVGGIENVPSSISETFTLSALFNEEFKADNRSLPIAAINLEQPVISEDTSSKSDGLPRSSGVETAPEDLDEESPGNEIEDVAELEQSVCPNSWKDVQLKGEGTATKEKNMITLDGEGEEPTPADIEKRNPEAEQKKITAPAQSEEESETRAIEDNSDGPSPELVESSRENLIAEQPITTASADKNWQTPDHPEEKDIHCGEKPASQLTPEEWDVILENCGVMYGWCIDRTKNRIIRAPKAAFRLRSLPPPKQPLNPPLQKRRDGKPVQTEDGSKESLHQADGLAQVFANSQPKSLMTKPACTVNDNSHIDVIVSGHEFETSMAMNGFSSQFTETSISGGIKSLLTTDIAPDSSPHFPSNSISSDQYDKTMVAKFLCPRLDISLHPSHLEPTPELEEALRNLKNKKNIIDLRKLQNDFGYLFCTRVTLGGRLQTVKIMDTDSQKSHQEQKQDFKTEVGLAISSLYGGESTRRSEEGFSVSFEQSETQQNRQHVFEAVGGDSLLACNPKEWLNTVGKPSNWRAIDRDCLKSMADVIADLPGHGQVKTWYRKAAPSKLKNYIVFSGTGKQIRLRLLSPNHGLCCSHLRNGPNYNSPAPPKYYLGHRPNWAAMPRAMSIDPEDQWNKLISKGEGEFLFSPPSYRAPAIYGYASNKVGNSEHGANYEEELSTTVWNIFAVQDEALCNGSQVTLRTLPKPIQKTQNEALMEKKQDFAVHDVAKTDTSLMVFRNQQGVFLPVMSDTEEIQIWRILKNGSHPKSRENIKEGDEIRLAWCFEDQNFGYRDFTDDVFGRCRTTPPPGMENTTLYMKLPWPRFEPVAKNIDSKEPSPNALVMSACLDDSSTWPPPIEELETLFARNTGLKKKELYYLEDCSFRLDFVGNQGRGEAQDYLLQAVEEGCKF